MKTLWNDSKLTEHFALSEYCVNQTEDCLIGNKAIEHAKMMEEFRSYVGKPLKINAWYRTKAYNKKVGGVANSNHLNGCACDISMSVTESTFVKYAKKWKSICKKYNTVGEVGYYTGGWIHLGSHITYSSNFTNWKTDSKGQHNDYFKGKI